MGISVEKILVIVDHLFGGFTMNNVDLEYFQAVRKVLSLGETIADDRTGVGTISVFGDLSMRFDLRERFPLLLSKKVWFHGVIGELIWFLSGSNDVTWLQKNNIHIWDEWQREDGTIGRGTYGQMWRDFHGVDQIQALLRDIRNNPRSRRLLVSAWDPSSNIDAALPPCHIGFQIFCSPCGEYMDLSYWMRSNDLFLGAPFNIASYSALLCILCSVTGKKPRFVTHTVVGDAHIYSNHLDQIGEQLSRQDILPDSVPKLIIAGISKESDLKDLQFDNFHIEDYHPLPAIKAPIAV